MSERPRRGATAARLARTAGAGALALLAAAGPVLAQTGLPLPRFASLKAGKVNLRAGPGRQYPVDWVLLYRTMPVEIVGEFEHWRRIGDWRGAKGWVHRSMLSGRRTVIVTGRLRPLRRAPGPSAAVIARVEEKVVGRLLDDDGDWCRVEIAGLRGWMRRSHVWGSGSPAAAD